MITSARGAAAGGFGTALLVALAGCGSGSRYAFAEVEGKVTFKNRPLCGVIVRFYPDFDDGEQRPYATGTTDVTGSYKLTSMNGEAGALVGRHRVVVSWPPPDRNPDKAPPPPPYPPIPLKYTVADLTPLVVTVNEDGPQTINLQLTP
jgi:hypothetical protein